MKSTIFAAALLIACATVRGQDQAKDDQKEKRASEAFKNVQVLKDVPASQWYETMSFFAGSLGVTCDHCHTSSFEKDDDSPKKLKARQMIRMVQEINTSNFVERNMVTCNTCHHGNAKPEPVPVSNMDHWRLAADNSTPLPSAEKIIDRYRRSAGVAASDSVIRQSASFEIETYFGAGDMKKSSVELVVGGADKVRMLARNGDTAKLFVKSGAEAWVKDAKGWRAMDGGEAEELRGRVSTLAPDQVGAAEGATSVGRERVYGQLADVVEVNGDSGRKRFYFDDGSGLLLRKRIFFPSYFADGSVDVEYADYRKVGTLMLPFTIRVINAGGDGLTIRRALSRRINVPLKESEFSRPVDKKAIESHLPS